MNMYLIIMEGNYGTIDADYSLCHGYYIIKFSSSPYSLQSYLSIDGRVISSDEMVSEGTNSFPININFHYYVLQKNKFNNTIIFIRTMINGNVNIICYYSKDVVPLCLWSI